jgi:CheY-like chemotaxis protein
VSKVGSGVPDFPDLRDSPAKHASQGKMAIEEAKPVTAAQILLVEDDPDHRELALLALQQNGLADQAVMVNDGIEALEVLSRRPLPKLIVLDLQLPRMSGLELLRHIRKSESTRYLPVVILSSSDEESDILRSHESGANSYIVKPLDFENFTEAVRQVGAYWLTLNRTPITPAS